MTNNHFAPTDSDLELFGSYIDIAKNGDVYGAITALSSDTTLVAAHRAWERADKAWATVNRKASTTRYDSHLAQLATEVSDARTHKDEVSNAAARVAWHIAEEYGDLTHYHGDRLGTATVVDDVTEGSAEWLNLRKTGIGGSSLSKILGVSYRSTPGRPQFVGVDDNNADIDALLKDKVSPATRGNDHTNGILFRGHCWEPAALVVARERLGINVGVSKATWRGGRDDVAQIINVDGLILDDDNNPIGIVECKTSSRTWTWEKGVPLSYRIQVLWYLAACGFDKAAVVVRFDSGTFDTFTIHADDTLDGTDATEPIDHYITHPMFDGGMSIGGYDLLSKSVAESRRAAAGEVPFIGDCVSTLYRVPRIDHEWEQKKNTRHGFDIADVCAPDTHLGVQVTYEAPYERMNPLYTRISTVSLDDDTFSVRPYDVLNCDTTIGDNIVPMPDDHPDTSLPIPDDRARVADFIAGNIREQIPYRIVSVTSDTDEFFAHDAVKRKIHEAWRQLVVQGHDVAPWSSFIMSVYKLKCVCEWNFMTDEFSTWSQMVDYPWAQYGYVGVDA